MLRCNQNYGTVALIARAGADCGIVRIRFSSDIALLRRIT
jgi:hypothetical protein